jgi:ParB/RepB/Spo0J family partition protein
MSGTLTTLRLSEIKPAEDNLRESIDPGELKELASSIKENGILQPLLLNQDHLIVAGHRRHAAVALLVESGEVGADFGIPVVVRQMTEAERQAAMVVENLQRTDLNPVEEARGFQRLVDLGLTQTEVANRIGRNKSHISRRLGLLRLPIEAQDAIGAGKVDLDVAAKLIQLDSPEVIMSVVNNTNQAWAATRALEKQQADKEEAKVAAAVIKAGKDLTRIEGSLDEESVTNVVGEGNTLVRKGEPVYDWSEKSKVPAGATHFTLTTNYDGFRLSFFAVTTVEDAGQDGIFAKPPKATKTDAEKAEAKAARELKRQEDSFLAQLVKRPKKGDVLQYALDVLTDSIPYAWCKPVCEALDIEGIDVAPKGSDKPSFVYDKPLRRFIEESDANQVKAAMAILTVSRRTKLLTDYGFQPEV